MGRRSAAAYPDTRFNRRDVLACALVLLCAAALLCALRMSARGAAASVVVLRGGTELARLPLDEDAELPVDGGENIVCIEGGRVRMLFSTCEGQDCVRQGSIGRVGETIACLPHRLTVRIEGGGGVDAVLK